MHCIQVKGLFKGIAYPLLGQAAINATVFGVESMVYRRLPNENENSLNVWNSAIAGCCAGAVQSIIVCPMELVKIRMQNQGIGKQHVSPMMRRMGVSVAAPAEGKLLQSYRGPLETTKHIVYSEGAQGMFKGWWLTIFREVPQFGIYFGTYAWIRLRLGSLIGVSPEDLGVIYLSLAGGMTGVVTWCWYPVDVIKSRFQNDGGKLKYSGVLDCMKKSVQSDGMGVFVKGLQPTLIRGFVNGFATFPVFTLVMRFLSK